MNYGGELPGVCNIFKKIHYFFSFSFSFALCSRGCVGIMVAVSSTTANGYYGAATVAPVLLFSLHFFYALFSILYVRIYVFK